MKKIYEDYKKYIPAIFFVLGFLLDVFTLGEIDDFSNILVHFFYIIISGLLLQLEYLRISEIKSKNFIVLKLFQHRTDIFHFCLGSLLSSFTLFYFKSSSITNSYILMVTMVILLILNELEEFQKFGMIMRSSLFYLCLLTFVIYIIPIAIGFSGIFIFFASVVVCLIASFFTKRWVSSKNKELFHNTQNIFLPHLGISIIFTLLYLTKVFPPIPLSLKYIGVFHNIEKVNGNYLTTEYRPSWKFWHNGDQDFQYMDGDTVYIFTKIFSPSGFKERINISWAHEVDGIYKTSDRIKLNIKGGRRQGYRAYAKKRNIRPGQWRVKIETDSGLEIGRIHFYITKEKYDKEKFTKTKRI